MRLTLVIPAKNEADRIERALHAAVASALRSGTTASILVFANDCEDATADIARRVAGTAPIDVRVVEATLEPAVRDAGRARRRAAELALDDDRPDLIVTSDADATLTPETLGAMAEAIADGADVVCGRISTRLPASARTPSLLRMQAVSAAYREAVHTIRFGIDVLFGRQTHDRRPHYTRSGACMALTAGLHDRMGGLPDVPVAEDRALVREAEALGARIRYCNRARARVSPRFIGRAAGGMAETLRAHAFEADPPGDEEFAAAVPLANLWRTALEARGGGSPPVMPVADPRLRASELERELPRLRHVVETEVQPWLVSPGAARTARRAA
jgi:cellulose synthase/poly-beta-1,6-N-acetylglucosamine synthase-like glycosyltransferase